MITGACPRCGGHERRSIAPGFYECLSQVVVDVVPPGTQGNVTEVPVPGQCGHRYQEGGPSAPASTCSCGMFAVGACATCGLPRCGQHGSHDQSGYFVCNDHIVAARREAADEQAERSRVEVEQAQAAVAAERDRLRESFPGLPVEAPADASQLASALGRHVPERRQEFETGRRSFGRRTVTHGWSFFIGLGEQRMMGQESLYLVVTVDGAAYRCGRVASGPPTSILGAMRTVATINARYLRKVTSQLVAWTGKEDALAATDMQRYLVELHANGVGPSFEVWLRDN
jgi:hypothetical protein